MLKPLLILLCALTTQSQLVSLTEDELREYDGADASKPIYLAINGSIYDVSASPAFYGPGGNYHHFTGRDGSRAWVTECWDTEDQLTWRMDGVEKMFIPRYLDEELEKVATGGEVDLDLGGFLPQEQLTAMAVAALQRLGKVSDEQKAARRKEDQTEAKQKVHDTLKHWIRFFSNNPKYKIVGNVLLDNDNTPAPPALCEKAIQKRPLKGGRIDSLMNVAEMGKKAIVGDEEDVMPDFVKATLNEHQHQEDDHKAKDEL